MNKLIINLLEDKIEEYSNYAKEEYDRHNYYCWDEKYKQNLITLLKIRSEYKRALKEYKKHCRWIEISEYKKAIDEYRKHPYKFLEKYYGFKLLPHQKVLLKLMRKYRV